MAAVLRLLQENFFLSFPVIDPFSFVGASLPLVQRARFLFWRVFFCTTLHGAACDFCLASNINIFRVDFVARFLCIVHALTL